MKQRTLLQEIVHDARNNRMFMSWMMFDFSTWTNYAFVLLYVEECIRLRSVWMGMVSLYYGMIALLRTHWSKIIKKIYKEKAIQKQNEIRKDGVRSIGLLLMGMNMIFGLFVILVVNGDGSFHYAKGIFYLIILYTLFGFWASLTNAIRDRGIGIMWSALRMINLSAALTGLFILFAGLFDNYILDMRARNILVSIVGSILFLILMFLTMHTVLLEDKEEIAS